MNKITIISLLLLGFSFNLLAQTPQKIEQDLVKSIKEFQKYSDYGNRRDEDKRMTAGKIFEEKLLKYAENPLTLKYAFPALGKLMFIATSEDGKFRIYTWDAEGGGTMHEYYRVYQFQGADGKVYAKGESDEEENGSGSFVYSIFTQNTKDGNVYAVCSNSIASNIDHYQAVSLFKIEGAELKDKIKLFKTKEGLTNSIGFEYDFFSVADRKERPIKLIVYDKMTQTIKIPVVIQDKKFPLGKVTNRFINYKFNGEYFVNVK